MKLPDNNQTSLALRGSYSRRAIATAMMSLPLATAYAVGHAQTPDATPTGSPVVSRPSDAPLDAAQVEQAIRQVAEWQINHPEDYPTGGWVMAPLYDGLIDASIVTGDPRYLAPVIRAGRQIDFSPGNRLGDADSHAASRSWLRIHLMDPERTPEIVDAIADNFDAILAERIRGEGWSWVDALYMAPPTLVLLSAITGDQRYRDLAFTELVATYSALYDPEVDLFYRDANFFDAYTPSGEGVFWSRGNGWVYAGLAEMIDEVPAGELDHAFYIGLLREMSPALLQAQQPDGLWYPNLVDPMHVFIGETSGSALFTFGFAKGLREGILDEATYLPALTLAWNGLLTRIQPDGEVDYVQPVEKEPEPFDPDTSVPFGSGPVLGAGAEIIRLLGAAPQVDLAALRAEAEELADSAPDLSTDVQ